MYALDTFHCNRESIATRRVGFGSKMYSMLKNADFEGKSQIIHEFFVVGILFCHQKPSKTFLRTWISSTLIFEILRYEQFVEIIDIFFVYVVIVHAWSK